MTTIDNQTYFKAIYAVFAGGFVLQFAPYMWMISFPTLIVVMIILHQKRTAVTGTVYESHARWMIRTCWIGIGVIMPIALTLLSIAFHLGADRKPLIGIAQSGAEITDQVLQDTIMEPNAQYLTTLMTITFISIAAWWLWRCWAGYKHLHAGQAVPYVKRFWY
jgi:uncharacterized membrane protein